MNLFACQIESYSRSGDYYITSWWPTLDMAVEQAECNSDVVRIIDFDTKEVVWQRSNYLEQPTI